MAMAMVLDDLRSGEVRSLLLADVDLGAGRGSSGRQGRPGGVVPVGC
jgi:hypothetical protein